MTFTATVEDWTAIRGALSPAKLDPKPALWEWLGTVTLTKKDGELFQVELYDLPYPTGAFAIGEKADGRVYYRGGKSADLVKAVIAAYDRSKKADE